MKLKGYGERITENKSLQVSKMTRDTKDKKNDNENNQAKNNQNETNEETKHEDIILKNLV